jgi:hypothetical protein
VDRRRGRNGGFIVGLVATPVPGSFSAPNIPTPPRRIIDVPAPQQRVLEVLKEEFPVLKRIKDRYGNIAEKRDETEEGKIERLYKEYLEEIPWEDEPEWRGLSWSGV